MHSTKLLAMKTGGRAKVFHCHNFTRHALTTSGVASLGKGGGGLRVPTLTEKNAVSQEIIEKLC